MLVVQPTEGLEELFSLQSLLIRCNAACSVVPAIKFHQQPTLIII